MAVLLALLSPASPWLLVASCRYQHRVSELQHPYTFAPCTHHEHTHTCSKSDGVRRCTTKRRSRGTQCIPHVFSGLGTCWFRRGGERLSRRGRRGRALGGCRCRLLAVPPTALLLLLAVCVQSEVGIGTLCSRLPRGILHVTTQPSHNHHNHHTTITQPLPPSTTTPSHNQSQSAHASRIMHAGRQTTNSPRVFGAAALLRSPHAAPVAASHQPSSL